MANFRNLLLAFAGAAVFASVSANAQVLATNQALQCVANAGVPPLVRAEGLAELVGDVTLNCQGGIPTQVNAQVPATNIRVFLNTNITSRIIGGSNFSEALLMIDEPHSTTNPTIPLLICGAATAPEVVNSPGVCAMTGTGNGLAVYNGSANRPNVFQGRQVLANAVEWAGVPVDPPGTQTTRIIRMTNIRANANQLGVSSTLVPTQITMFISITGATSVPINNPTQTVAFIQVGLASSVRGPGNFLQCISQNPDLAAGNSTSPSPNSVTGSSSALGNQGYQFVVRAVENFPSAFKKLNAAQVNPAAVDYPAGFWNQNVPGAIYNTEDGFVNTASAFGRGYTDPSPNPPGQLVSGSPVGATPTFPTSIAITSSSSRNPSLAGAANHGTRLIYQFSGVPNGVQLWIPVTLTVTSNLTSGATGTARLTNTDSNGAGGFSPVSGNGSGLTQVSVFNGAGIAVYEVLFADPFTQERIDLPVAVAYVANPSNNLPTPGVQSGVTVSFAPLSTVGTASDTAPIPRFVPSPGPRNTFIVQKCNCNMLFPFVSNQIGFDTGIAISNTSLDTGTGLGATPQQGVVTLNYYCGQTGCTSPPAQTTNAPLPAGQQLTFTLSGGGGYGIAATPGFQGYIIAQAQFQWCHAFAYISAQGALPTSNGASMGYLGLIMDKPDYRPGVTTNENLGH